MSIHNRKDTTFTMRISREQLDSIKTVAKAKNTTCSKLIRTAVDNVISNDGQTNGQVEPSACQAEEKV